MYEFNVPDMTCGHCASTITKALKAEDPGARIEIDLSQRRVKVQSALSQDEVARQIAEAGYTPSPLA